MKTFVIFLTALLLLYSSTIAGSLAYYPSERESNENPGPFVGAILLGTFAAVITANHIHKLDKLSKRPLLSKEDVRGLKSRRIVMPIGGAFCTALGVGSINGAQEDDNAWLYVTSAVFFVNGALAFVDGLKSHKVLSKYNSQEKR